jgi:hypothetical protein
MQVQQVVMIFMSCMPETTIVYIYDGKWMRSSKILVFFLSDIGNIGWVVSNLFSQVYVYAVFKNKF